MSNGDINPFDWYRNFFIGSDPRKRSMGKRFFDRDFFEGFEEMQDEIEKIYEQFRNIQNNAPKDLVREYQTSDGDKIREIGPIVYGYSMTIGPDGKPHVREFGNVKSISKGMSESGKGDKRGSGLEGKGLGSQINVEREPLADINVTENEVKVILELPGVKKEDIKINVFNETLEIKTNDPHRKYHRTLELPSEANTESVKCTYNNGILEITFDKKRKISPRGKEIKID